ncbi:STAM2 family protein [Megaselia abdita]
MGIFGGQSSSLEDVEKATNEKNTSEDWTLIIEVCDKITQSPRNTKDYVKAILKRMGHNDPHVVIQALTLLDACINNCGKTFHLEVASRDFETEYRKLLSKVEPTVATKMKLKLKRWSENEFKADPQLNLIPTFYQKLKAEGHDFTDYSQKTAKTAVSAVVSKDPNVVTSQQEEDDLAKAIELSLKESAKPSPNKQVSTTTTSASSAYPSLYPSFTSSANASPSATSTTTSAAASAGGGKELRKVRALYDFEAAEDNELTFKTGEFIHVIDDADPNWWKGVNQRGEGLFPSNFVTSDLNDQDNFEDKAVEKQKASKEEEQADKNFVPEVNEEKIDRLLHLLHEANPEDPSQDPPEMLRLENEVHQMGPLIDAELERVDRKNAQLTMLSSNLVDAINLYHTLMRDDRMGGFGSPYGRGQPQQPPPQTFAQPGSFSMYPMNPGMYQGGPGMHGQFMPPPPQQQQQPPVPMNYQNGHQPPPQMMQQQQPPPPPSTQQPQIYNLPPQQPTQFTAQFPHQNGLPQAQALPPPQQQQQQQQPAPPMMENGMNQHFNPMMMMGPPGPPQPSHQQQLPNSFQQYPHLANPGLAAAAAAMGINAINQPVTQSFLGQNDNKNNIPVYQQQR